MSEENVEKARQMFALFRGRDATAEDEFGGRDVAKALELFHPDFELDTTRAPMPDLRGKFRGNDVLTFWRRWLEAWESIEFQEELTDAGDCVLAEITQQMRGKGSGIEVPFPPYWMVITVREGRIIGQALFLDELEALEAAGLSGHEK
jgi:ketosteroid isomerase-like protein